MYKINEIAKIVKISTRTLRYYDQIGLLEPSIHNNANYRIYTDDDIDLLQQILFYKQLGFKLLDIKSILNKPDFNFEEALVKHKDFLIMEKERISKLIKTINTTISYRKGETMMSNNEKFEGFKTELINRNEKEYGNELRDKYSSEIIDASNDKIRKMSKWEYKEAERLSSEIIEKLKSALEEGDPNGSIAQEVCQLHQTWIKLYWPNYSVESHLGLVKMYTIDTRFSKYYEKAGKGAAEFLYSAMKIYHKEVQ